MPVIADPIEFDGVTKRFRRRTVLDGLSFTVPEATIVGLLGPNGAGKSTAMRVLLGLQRPTAGAARILGHEAGTHGFRAAVRRCGAIIESPPVYKNATPLQNLEIRIAATGLSIKAPEVREILHRVGLAERADDRVGTFSLGMRQRMGIALALVGDPSVVILDEPTNGLDPEGAVEMRELIRALPARGATTLLCTHRLAEVERTCDYVVVLQEGHLVTQGTLAEIIAAGAVGGVEVTVAPAELAAAAAVVDALALGAVTADGGVIVTERTPDDPAQITRALADAGIYLRGLRARETSLEDAFLKLTRHEAEEAA